MSHYLSIDWDYFVPELPEWDLGHRESLFFLSLIWKTRYGLLRQMKTTEGEQGWARDNLASMQLPTLAVSDSHLAAWTDPRLHDCDTLWLVDAHHDAWAPPAEQPQTVACDTWVHHWLGADPTRQVRWLRPGHSRYEVPRRWRSRIRVLRYESEWRAATPRDFAGFHVCRSGCWTPPWLDAAFQRFVLSLPHRGGMQILQRDEWCDPMACRWTLSDYRAAVRDERMLAQYRQHLTRAGALVP